MLRQIHHSSPVMHFLAGVVANVTFMQQNHQAVGSSAGAEKITTVQEAADLISQQIK